MDFWDHFDEGCRRIGFAVVMIGTACALYAVVYLAVYGAWPALR